MPRGQKTVWCVPKWVTFDNLAHVTWARDGDLNKGRFGAKVTAPRGTKRFRTYAAAKAFAKKQALRMGEGTDLGIHGGVSEYGGKNYIVRGGKLVEI